MTKKILVVDPDAQFTESFGLKLTERGYLVKCEQSGEKGLASIPTYRPDLVFVERTLPDMDSDQFLSGVRYPMSKPNKDVPIVVIGSRAKDKEFLEIHNNGADYVIEKPFTDISAFRIVDYLIGDISDEERERLEALI
ncbi:MAG TPA: response regulator [archaeon]|nr:response regulator [archaeon]